MHFWFFFPNDVMVIANKSHIPIGKCSHLLNRFCFVMQSAAVKLNVHKNREHSRMKNVEQKRKTNKQKTGLGTFEASLSKKGWIKYKKALDCFYSKPLLQIPVLIMKTCHLLVLELEVLLYIFTTRFPHTFKMWNK